MTQNEQSSLFQPLKKGRWNLPHRIALAPMTRSRATVKCVPTDIMITYYEQRSDAFLITEGTIVSKQGLGWFKAPGIWTEEQTNAWKPVTEAVHKRKGIIGCQLWHLGRQGHSFTSGEKRTVSASPIPLKGQVTTRPSDEEIEKGVFTKGIKKDYEVPYPLLNENGKHGHDDFEDKEYSYTISQVVKDYGLAAKNSMIAGFDFVEIHGANGYLIDQFIQSCSNKRNDNYGGSIDNRLRFMREVVTEVIKQVGDKQKVGIRLSPNGNYGGMGSKDNLETFDAAIKWLSSQKLAYIHIMDGLGFGFHKLCDQYTLKRARKIVNENNTDSNNPTLLIGNCGHTKESGEKEISEGNADLIAYGRPYIGTPDLPWRWQNGYKLNEVPPHSDWWGITRGPNGYIDFEFHEKNPRQNQWLKNRKNNDNKN